MGGVAGGLELACDVDDDESEVTLVASGAAELTATASLLANARLNFANPPLGALAGDGWAGDSTGRASGEGVRERPLLGAGAVGARSDPALADDGSGACCVGVIDRSDVARGTLIVDADDDCVRARGTDSLDCVRDRLGDGGASRAGRGAAEGGIMSGAPPVGPCRLAVRRRSADVFSADPRCMRAALSSESYA